MKKAAEADGIGNARRAVAAWDAMYRKGKEQNNAPAVCLSLSKIAGYKERGGNRVGAWQDLQEARRWASEAGEYKNEEMVLLQLAGVASQLPDQGLGVALDYAQYARTLSHDHQDTDNEISGLNGMAMAYYYLGDLERSFASAKEAVDLSRSVKDTGRESQALRFMGLVLQEIGDYAGSLDFLQQSRQKAREAGDKENEAEALNEMGITYEYLEDYDTAIATLEEAYGINHWRGTQVNLAGVYQAAGRYEKARALYDTLKIPEGMDDYRLEHGEFRQVAKSMAARLKESEKGNDFARLRGLYVMMGMAQEGLKRYDLATFYYEKSAALTEETRDGLSELQRMHFYAGKDGYPRLEAQEGLVRVTQFLPAGAAGALYHAEFTRGRLFTEAAARRYGLPETHIPEALARRETGLAETVKKASQEREIAFRSNDPSLLAVRGATLAVAKEAQLPLVAEFRRDYPEYASVRYPQPVPLENLAIQADETLIEFEVTRYNTQVFVIEKGTIPLTYVVPLKREDLEGKVRAYLSGFANVEDTSRLAAFDPKASHELYDLLLRPALEATGPSGKPLIPKDRKLVVIPDESLDLLPFESLVVSLPARGRLPSAAHGSAPLGVRYVADDYDIAYAHSATALTVHRNLKQRSAPSREMFVLADPVFNASDRRSRALLARKNGDRGSKLMGVGGARRGDLFDKRLGSEKQFLFPRLDKTSLLARSLSRKVFPGAVVLAGDDAAESRVQGAGLADYRYLVFATHGILDDTVPGVHEPALVLNQVGNEAGSDGFLTMSEVMGLNLKADVVALTACQTALGKRVRGEGVMGMGRAFQYAGARNVLVSLWSVAEDSTTELAQTFFERLKAGDTPRQALRKARTDIRRKGYEHPFYWAPFILVGE